MVDFYNFFTGKYYEKVSYKTFLKLLTLVLLHGNILVHFGQHMQV